MYERNYWGRLSQFQIPNSIVRKDTLVLKAGALSVLLTLLQSARARASYAREQTVCVTMKQKLLQERTGLSKNSVGAALKELEQENFLKRVGGRRRKHGEFGASEYLICNPASGDPLPAIGTNFLYSNRVPYLNFPRCVVRKSSADWAIASMTGSEVRLYVSLCWLANEYRSNRFTTTALAARRLAGMEKVTFEKALAGLESRHLVSIGRVNDALEVELCDPYTGEPLNQLIAYAEDDPANYYVIDEKGRAERVNLNNADPHEAEQLVRSCLSQDARVIQQSNGDIKICCPFHDDSNPSLSFSPVKRCFYCFGCERKGTRTELLMRLKVCSKKAAIEYIGEATGKHIEYHEPDRNAVIYSYRDKKGKLIKQVLRYANKKFVQRRPGPGGTWIYNLYGVPPRLYNLDRLQYANTVLIVEGEKDCGTVMARKLVDCEGHEIIATTSGSADSWADSFADELVGKRVVILQDADEAGERYATAVIASLEERGIEYRRVSFADAGAKDVTEFLVDLGHTDTELVQRIGEDWVTTKELHQKAQCIQDFVDI